MSRLLLLCLCILLITSQTLCVVAAASAQSDRYGRESEEDHHHDDGDGDGDDHHDDDDHSFAEEVFEPFYDDLNVSDTKSLSLEQFDILFDELFAEVEDDHSDHGHGVKLRRSAPHVIVRTARRLKNVARKNEEEQEDHHDDGDEHHEDGDEHGTNHTTSCIETASTIFKSYDTNDDMLLSSEELLNASATLFLMITDDCVVSHEGDEHHDDDDHNNATSSSCEARTTSGQAWGYAMLSVAIVSVPSLLGIAFLPVGGSKAMTYLLEAALSLGVGTLLGSVLMHLLPLVLGVHNTQFLTEAERHTLEEAGELDFLWPLCVSMAVLLIFFAAERLIRDWRSNHLAWTSRMLQIEVFELLDDWGEVLDDEQNTEQNNQRNLSPQELRPIAYILVIADFLHNFADGLAIGASWVLNVRVGIATTIAVLCHEIPQEIGDYAVLIQSGIKKKTAILLNLAVSGSCLLGAVISVAIGTQVALAQRWVISVAMGGFIYVGLAAMVPVLTSIQGPKHSALQSVMMLVGFLIMFLLAIFEFQIDCPSVV